VELVLTDIDEPSRLGQRGVVRRLADRLVGATEGGQKEDRQNRIEDDEARPVVE
jgi:hypothetical protein